MTCMWCGDYDAPNERDVIDKPGQTQMLCDDCADEYDEAEELGEDVNE